MTAKRTKKTKTTLDDLKEVATREIEKSKITIGYYERESEKELDAEARSKFVLKAQQLKDNLKFNESFNDYLNTL